MEELIRQAFLHVDILGPHVHQGHYDLVGSDGEIILPHVWDTLVEPNMDITMHMWPMPEAEKGLTEPSVVVVEAPNDEYEPSEGVSQSIVRHREKKRGKHVRTRIQEADSSTAGDASSEDNQQSNRNDRRNARRTLSSFARSASKRSNSPLSPAGSSTSSSRPRSRSASDLPLNGMSALPNINTYDLMASASPSLQDASVLFSLTWKSISPEVVIGSETSLAPPRSSTSTGSSEGPS